jgi:hypothetical protein
VATKSRKPQAQIEVTIEHVFSFACR